MHKLNALHYYAGNLLRYLKNPIYYFRSGKNPDPGTSKAPWRVYNIGNQSPVELMDYIETLEKFLGKKAEKVLLPLQPGDVPDTYADVEALVQDVGYKPNTTIEQGIEKFAAWYNSYYNTFNNIINIGKITAMLAIVENLYWFTFLNGFSK
jgi:hypothetical protein